MYIVFSCHFKCNLDYLHIHDIILSVLFCDFKVMLFNVIYLTFFNIQSRMLDYDTTSRIRFC